MGSLAPKKNMTHPKMFLAKSLKSAKWTCLTNMGSLGPKKNKNTHPKTFFGQKSKIGQMDMPAKYGAPSSMGSGAKIFL